MGDTGGVSHIYTKEPYIYHHSSVVRSLLTRLGGRSLFRVQGEKEHKRMRGLVAPAFSSDHGREMHADLYLVATALQTRIVNEIHASGKSSIQVNILDYTSRATLDIIGRVAFGHDFNAVGDAPDAIEINRRWRAQNEMGCKHSAFVAMLVLRLFPSITSLPLPALQAQVAVSDTIRNLAKDIVANSQIDNKGNGKDLMSLMLKANARQHESKRCDMPEIYDHVVTFVYVAILRLLHHFNHTFSQPCRQRDDILSDCFHHMGACTAPRHPDQAPRGSQDHRWRTDLRRFDGP